MELLDYGFTMISSLQRVYDDREVEGWFSKYGKVHIDEGRMRVQVADRDIGTWLATVLNKACAAAGVIGMREFHGANVYGLRTKEGWMVPQTPHTDYEHGKVVHLLNQPERIPISAIWAACDDFELVDYSHMTIRKVQAGMIAVFRLDRWHGGGPCVRPQLRVHGYGAPAAVQVPTGGTYVAGD